MTHIELEHYLRKYETMISMATPFHVLAEDTHMIVQQENENMLHKQIFAKGLFSSHCPMSIHGAGRLGETGAGTREPCLVQLGRAEQRSSSETLFAEECDARSPLRRDAVTLDAETRDAGITPPLSRMDGQHYQCACWELGTTWILYCWQNEKFQKSFSFIVPDSFTC